jgi:hypothetical protein
MLTIIAAITANAETLSTTIYKWDATTKTAVKAENTIDVEASIDGSVITFSNFLGSDATIEVTAYSDKTATHNQPTGSIKGTFTLGEFGSYDDIYLYAGEYGYDDFDYYVEDGVKTLHGGFYAGDDWFDIYFVLPDSYEPVEPANPYKNKVAFNLPVSFTDYTTGEDLGSDTATAYLSGNQVILKGLFGVDEIVYTIAEDGSISSNLSKGYVSGDFTYNGVNNSYAYFYGSTYLKYDAATRTITDYVYFYYSNADFNFSFQIPEIQSLNTKAGVYDYTEWEFVYSEAPIATSAVIEGSDVTLLNYFGSNTDIKLTAYTTGKIDQDKEYGDYAGDYDLGDSRSFDNLRLYGGQWSIYDFYYSDGTKEDEVKSFYGYQYFYKGDDYKYVHVIVELPESYEAVDPFADKDIIDVPVTFVASGDVYNAKAYVEGNTIIFTDLFTAVGVEYTIEDGEISSPGEGYDTSFVYNDVEQTYIYFEGDYDDAYFTYDAETYTVTVSAYFYDSWEEVYFSFVLPEALRPTTGVSSVAVDANSPVEYFNLQGVRVANPENGIFIRRQGKKVQKVVVR